MMSLKVAPRMCLVLMISDPPKKVSVSIRPFGEIVEGSSVNLTCSSDANPPVKIYIWFKGTSSVGIGKTFTISSISSEDSGEYKCKCKKEVRYKYSSGVTLNVLYPPKKVSVSIKFSGKIVEGSSVTLTCSSDANPPVKNYTWFKVNESSPVGSGQSYRALQSGQYYCEAQNKHGFKRSAAVSVTLKGFQNVGVCAGVGVVFVCLILFLWKKKRIGSTADQSLQQDDIYSNVTVTQPINTNTISDSASANQDEVLYTNIIHWRATDLRNPESPAVKASVSEAEEVQYAIVRFPRTSAADRIRPFNAEDPTVIYSSVK